MKQRFFLMVGVITGILLFMIGTASTVSADTIVAGPHYIADTNVYWHIMRIDATYETRLTIAGSGGIPFYDSSNDTPWVDYKSQITEIKVENGITSLGKFCFANMINLYSADLGDTVQDIAPYAFANCTTLKYVYLPKHLYTLYDDAFYNCKSLTNVTLPTSNSYYKIENGIMTDSDGKYIYWGGGITGDEYYIPSTVTNIAGSAFPVPMTTKIYVPDTVTGIALEGFRYDHNVCGVAGSALEEYMTDPFVGGSLAETYDGMCGPTVFWKMETQRILLPSGKTTTRVTLTLKGKGTTNDYPSSTPTPWPVANIEYLIVQGEITNLGSHLLNGATSLTSVTLPNSITKIGNSCFNDCTALASISLPSSLEWVCASAFNGCSKLTGVVLPASTTRLDDKAFGYTALTEIQIPANLTTMTSTAFRGCTSLEAINVNSQNSTFSSVDGVVFSNSNKTLYMYPAGKTTETYIVPIAVTRISSSIGGNENLKYIYISTNVMDISQGAFSDCVGLTIYGYKNTTAETYANENSIRFVPMEGTLKSNSNISWHFDYLSGELTLTGTGGIFDFDAPSNVPWSPWITQIETINVGEEIVYIGRYSFSGAENLETVYIPSTMIAIYHAFDGADALSDVYYPKSVDDWYAIYVNEEGNAPLLNATKHYGITQIINSVAVSGNYVFVSTTDVADGKKVMIAAYGEGGRFLELNYVDINNNTGTLSGVSTQEWRKVKAFMIDLHTLIPAANVAEFTIN